MSVTNFETRNAMAAKRVFDYPASYMNHQNGLIKSASTSSCSANEAALLKSLRASRYATNGRKYGSGEHEMAANPNERPKLFVLQPLSHSEQNMPLLATEIDSLAACNKSCYRKNIPSLGQSLYGSSKHLSDRGLASRVCSSPYAGKSEEGGGGGGGPCLEYSSHRNLDNVLVNKCNNSAILNFTAVNGFHGHHLNDKSRSSDNSSPNNSLRNKHTTVATAPTSKSSHEFNSAACKQSDNQLKTTASSTTMQSAAPSPSTPTSAVPNQSNASSAPASPSLSSSASSSAHQTEAKNINGSHDTDSSNAGSKDCARESAVSTSTGCTSIVEGDVEDSESPKAEKNFRRSSSLKMRKESTTNPAQKKIVRFADAMGLDLTDVRTFLDELPSVPKSAYNDLRPSSDLDLRNTSSATPPIDRLFGINGPLFGTAPSKSLVPMFKQPSISHNFLERIRDNNVCLEKAVVGAQPVCNITGTVRVRNIDFHKSVYVRYTLDNWRSFGEVQAVYVPDSCDGFSDQFSFIIYLYELPSSQRVELAIRYHCSGSIFWDNNLGANYVFQSSSSPPTIPSYFSCVQTSNDRCHSFY